MEEKQYGNELQILAEVGSLRAPAPQHSIYFLERVRVMSVSPAGEQTPQTYAALVAVKLKQARKQQFCWMVVLPAAFAYTVL